MKRSTGQEISEMIDAFAGLRCLVVGDVMVDRYLTGVVSRQSPEAPVPILDLQNSDARLGGAANVALNLTDFCRSVSLCSILGSDEAAEDFRHLLEVSGIDGSALVTVPDRPTTVKTRLMDANGHLMRVDRESTAPISEETIALVQKRLHGLITSQSIDLVILQDYNKGLLQPTLIEGVLELCQESEIPVAVDPKFEHISAYQGVDLFKPNLVELEAILGDKIEPTQDALDQAALKLAKQLSYKRLLVTLSSAGIYYRSNAESAIIPAYPRQIRDVCGAGDTVIAIAALALASESSLPKIAQIANLAGGIVCEFPGVKAISRDLLAISTVGF